MSKRKGKQFAGMLIMLCLVVIASACANGNTDENESPNASTPPNGEGQEIQFEAIDRDGLSEADLIAVYEEGEIHGHEFANYLAVQAFLNPNTPINDEQVRADKINELIMERILTAGMEEDQWAREQAQNVWEQIQMAYGEEILEDAYTTLQLNEQDITSALIALFQTEAYFREQVTEEEMLDFYDEVMTELTTATYTHILIATSEDVVEEPLSEEDALEKANTLFQDIQDGADMNALASEHTDDEGSAQNGGRYENMHIYELVPEFRDALLEQEMDEVGEPVKTDFGYHIIRAEDIQTMPYEEVSDAIIGELVHEKYMIYYFDELPDQIVEVHI